MATLKHVCPCRSIEIKGELKFVNCEYPLFDKDDRNKPKASAACAPIHIIIKQRAKKIVHLENRTCRKLMPCHQDPDLFLRSHSTVRIHLFILKRSVLEM